MILIISNLRNAKGDIFYFMHVYFILADSFHRGTSNFSNANSVGVISSTIANSLIMEVFRNINVTLSSL